MDRRVLMSHIVLLCLMYFFHCCCCSSPLCDLLSTPPSCARLFSHKHQSVNYLFSFFLKPLLVYDLSITVVLLFKFFFFHVLLREHGFPCVFLNALLKHFVNCTHTSCNSQWSKATWCSMGWLSSFSNKLSSKYISKRALIKEIKTLRICFHP